MFVEIAATSKSLETIITFMWFLSCVNSAVHFDTVVACEDLVTQVTREGPLAGVQSHVPCTVIGIGESFFTMGALEDTFPCVYASMFGESRLVTECLATILTSVWLFPSVCAHMSCQVTFLHECLGAKRTLEQFLTNMEEHMLVGICLVRESLVAIIA